MHWHIGKWLIPQQISPRGWMQAALGVALLATAAAASAQTPVEDYNDFEITPFFGYMAGGEFEDPATNTDRDIDEDNNFGVIFNAAVDEWRHYEVLYTQQS